jgi:hypothetical protein
MGKFLENLQQLGAAFKPRLDDDEMELRDLANAVLQAFKELWLGPGHRQSTAIRAELDFPFRSFVIAGDYPVLQHLSGFHRRLAKFFRSMGPVYGSVMGIGATEAGLYRVLLEPVDERGPIVLARMVPFIAEISSFVSTLSAHLPALQHLDTDLSERAYYLDPTSQKIDRAEWLKAKLDQLWPHFRTAAEEYQFNQWVGTTPPEGFWVSASEAAEIATSLDYRMDPSQITRLCDEQPQPFSWRKPVANRRQVHLPSFLYYVLRHRKPRDSAAQQPTRSLVISTTSS